MYFVSDIIENAPVTGGATRISLKYAQTGTSIRYTRSSSPHFAEKNAKGLRKIINFWIRVAPPPHPTTTPPLLLKALMIRSVITACPEKLRTGLMCKCQGTNTTFNSFCAFWVLIISLY